MSRARRILRWSVIGAGALVGLTVLFAAFVLFTTPGARLVLSVLNGRDLPIRARSIGGFVAGRFVLYDVELAQGPVAATLDTLAVAWRPLALFDRRVQITGATIGGAHVTITTSAEDTAAARGPAPADTAAARWIMQAEHVRVRRATLDAPGDVHLRDIDLSASGGPDGYRAEVRASGSVWQLADVNAFVRASGDTRGVRADTLDVRVLGGVVRGDASMHWAKGLSWSGRVRGDSLRTGGLAVVPADLRGTVSFRVSGEGSIRDDSTRIGIDIHSLDGTLRGRPLSARGRVDFDHTYIEASDAHVQWGGARAALSGRMGDVADVRFEATIPALGEIIPRARGSASVRGTLSGNPGRIDVDVDVVGRDVRAGRIEAPALDATLEATVAAADYVPHAADVHRLQVNLGESRLDAKGTVSWRDGIAWDATLAVQRFEVSAVTPARWNLQGPVSMRGATEGTKHGRRLRGRLALESLSGTVRGRALDGSGEVVLAGGDIDVSALRVEWGDTKLRADGRAGDVLDLDVELVAPNLAAIDSSLQGAVSLRGSAKGPRTKPRVIADIDADSLRVLAYRARRLEGHVDADLAFESPADVRLLALDAARGGTTADSVRVLISGPRDDQRVMLSVAEDSVRAAIELRGAFADTTWSGRIEDFRVAHDAVGEWRLRGRAPVFVSRSRVRADSLELVSGDAKLSVRGSWQKSDSTRAEIALSHFPLSVLQPFLAEGTRVTGTAAGSASLSIDPGGRVMARVDIVPGPGEFVMGDRKIAYEGRITGRAEATGVFAQVDVQLKHAGDPLATVDAEMSIPGFVPGRDSPGAQPVEGRIDVDCRNIAPVMMMVAPSLSESSGKLTAHIAPVGTAGNFRWKGRVELEDGSANLRSGLRLRDVDMTLVSDGEGKIALDGAATSGGGRVVVKANSARSEKAWLNGTFTARGERFLLVNQPEARVFVSPDIEVQVAERSARVTGRVRVPYARIETAEVPASAVSPSGDVVILEDTLSTRPSWQVQTDVNVELGDSVTFAGFGLQARLDGSLAVHDERGEPTRGTGEIRIVEGKYRAYGNELRIDQGRFIFGGGAVDNPGIDIRASRGLTTQNVMAGSGEVVGVNLRGTLQRPEVTLFSNPPMSQSEIMSYLVLGRPLDSSGDQSALASAALLVGMQRGTGVAGDIGKRLSLDEAYIEAGSGMKETSFVAGKYLSPKLYVSYATGLFEKTNTFRARYSLTRKWTLQAESGKESSSDLLYWFERGK